MKLKGAYQRLVQLVNLHKVDLVALQEPFLDNNNIEAFKRGLGFGNIVSNIHSKIWCF